MFRPPSANTVGGGGKHLAALTPARLAARGAGCRDLPATIASSARNPPMPRSVDGLILACRGRALIDRCWENRSEPRARRGGRVGTVG